MHHAALNIPDNDPRIYARDRLASEPLYVPADLQKARHVDPIAGAPLSAALAAIPACRKSRTALNDNTPQRKAPAMPQPETQAQFAKSWRQAQGLTRAELAEAIGFSASQIQDYEQGARRGKTGDDTRISPDAWKRYRLACAALAARLADPWPADPTKEDLK